MRSLNYTYIHLSVKDTGRFVNFIRLNSKLFRNSKYGLINHNIYVRIKYSNAALISIFTVPIYCYLFYRFVYAYKRGGLEKDR